MSAMREMKVASLSGIFLLSFLFDFSLWFPIFFKAAALLLQGGGMIKLTFEERYLLLRFRHLSWRKRLIPVALFLIALLFYIEKGFLFFQMWDHPDGSLAPTYRLYSMIFFGSAFSIYAMRLRALAHFLDRLHLKPAQTLALSFALLILAGALILSLPQVVVDPAQISFIDALFTATSATTVTGLSVAPISEYYQTAGQWVILLLIQLGGLGIMTFGALIFFLPRRRMPLQEEIALQGVLEAESIGSVRREIGSIFVITLTIEALGALLLWVFFRNETPNPLFQAIFHSISAFCNAGFSLFPTNLEVYVDRPAVNLIIIGLVILGGLGFPVLHNLGNYPLFGRGSTSWRLTFHSKMVLTISAGLLLAGTVGLFLLEYDRALAPLPWHHQWITAFFQSATARTAGFNTVNIARLSDASIFLMILLMWIGGSPISTAGGIKTTTFGVMLATLRSLLRRREEIEIFRRRLAPQAVQKALSVGFISSSLLALLLLSLLAVEEGDFKVILFEAVSAFNTVGLSIGNTAAFSPMGKAILILIMFIGRLGPLTIAYTLAERTSRGIYHYPEERVIVG
jgi:trk system potassium uptake protein TrkH